MNHRVSVLLDTADARWLAAADTCLTAEENARANRFHRLSDRNTWRAGRAWIRHQLGATLGLPPGHLTITNDSRGRPHITNAPDGFDCNWSHSGTSIALAYCHHARVGIDIELLRDDFPVEDVCRTVCTPTEQAALHAASSHAQRRTLFFNLWTAKEALMKATGLGVALDPATIEVECHNNHPTRFTSHPRWHLTCQPPTPKISLSWAWLPHHQSEILPPSLPPSPASPPSERSPLAPQ